MSKNNGIDTEVHLQNFIQKQNAKLAALRSAIKNGIDSGSAESFDIDDFISARECMHDRS